WFFGWGALGGTGLSSAKRRHPARTLLLLAWIEHEGAARRHIAANGRRRGDVGVVTDPDRRDQGRIAADLHAVADHRRVFAEAVIVARDRPGTDVDLAADLDVAEIRQMVGFGAIAESSVLVLDEVADVDLIAEPRLRPQVGERTDLTGLADVGLGDHHAETQMGAVADPRIDDEGRPVEAAGVTNGGGAAQLNVRPDHCVGA